MNDEGAGVLLALFVAVVGLTSVVLVGMSRWFALAALLGLLITGAAVIAAWAAWLAWLRGDRHQLATTIRARRADLAHQKAQALLDLELERVRRDAGAGPVSSSLSLADGSGDVVGRTAWGNPPDPDRPSLRTAWSARSAEGR